jgi:dTDP-4-amino-4,6-dideoxygalactose transaminase
MIPFNKPYVCGKELWNIAQAHANGRQCADRQRHHADRFDLIAAL